jgi:uncharacterized protein (UPF0276 family)
VRANDSRSTLPAAAGIPFKPVHWPAIEAAGGAAAWFEVHAENYLGAGGPPHRMLAAIRELRPLSIHGVGLSIGGEAPLDGGHLARIRALVERYEPASFSEHLAWSTHEGVYYNDLLPLPYNETTLTRVAAHVSEVQDVLGRRILIENPSTYLTLDRATMGEVEFLTALAERSGCGLLLDLNNVWVSANNQRFDPARYLASFPLHLVGEIHLAGHAVETAVGGDGLLLDTHDRPVDEAVWRLFAQTVLRTGPVPTLIEWDSSIPELPVLLAEAARADQVMAATALAA